MIEILGFAWQGSYYSTEKVSDWLICQTSDFSLVETLLSIFQPICTSSQPNFYHVQPFHIHIQQVSHISHMNLLRKMTTKNEMDADSGIMGHLDYIPIIPFENFNTYSSPYYFQNVSHFFKRNW